MTTPEEAVAPEVAQKPLEAPLEALPAVPGPLTPPEAVQTPQEPPKEAMTAQELTAEQIEKEFATAAPAAPPPEPPYPAEVVCKCGRKVPTDQTAKKPMGHRIGKEHPGFQSMNREKRKETWCPEGAERPPLPEKVEKKKSRRELRRG